MNNLNDLSLNLMKKCIKFNYNIGTAESCTGGMISSTITNIPGSSQIFDMGIVSYSNDAKIKFLNINPEEISIHGAVSRQVCSSMSKNLLKINPNIQLSVAVSGIAGPNSDDSNKDVGLVFISASHSTKTICNEHNFGDIGRLQIREATVLEAIALLNNLVDYLNIL
jgi:PncC family amidohydrolase